MNKSRKKAVKIEKHPDSLSVESLLKMDSKLAEKVFNRLPLKKKIEMVLSVPWKKRMDIILLADNSRQLIQALPVEELYWTVKERGVEDSVSLISMTDLDQFQYMVDIDCWNKDALDSSRINTWYKILGKCHESKVLEWFTNADEEFLIGSFKKLFKVFKIEEQSDLSEEYASMPSYTLDGIYFFQFKNDDIRVCIMPLLNVLYQHNRNRFYSLIEGVIWDFELEVEEDAFYWRQSRIAEKGFPNLDEALDVYNFISDKEIELFIRDITDKTDKENDSILDRNSINLRYMFSHGSISLFLYSIMQSIDNQEILDDFQRQMCSIANKIIIADSLEVKEIDDMIIALRKAAGYVNIGLEILSGGRINKAKIFLEDLHASVLFRIGYSCVLKMKNRVEKQSSRLWIRNREFFSTFFDTPWADALEGLDRNRPLFFKGITTKGDVEYKNFEVMEEIRQTNQVIDIVMVAETVLFDVFKIEPEYLTNNFLDETCLKEVKDIKCTSVFLTILANHILYGRTKLIPLTLVELLEFLKRIFKQEVATENFFLKRDMYDESISWISNQYLFEKNLKQALESFVYTCLNMLEDEFSSLVDKKTIDKKYVSGIILKK